MRGSFLSFQQGERVMFAVPLCLVALASVCIIFAMILVYQKKEDSWLFIFFAFLLIVTASNLYRETVNSQQRLQEQQSVLE